MARRRQARGAGIAAMARELGLAVGLAEWTLYLWLRKTSLPVLRAVEVIPTHRPRPPVLITPQSRDSASRPRRWLTSPLRPSKPLRKSAGAPYAHTST